MINIKKASLLATVSVMLVPSIGFAEVLQDVVHDARGNVVTSTNGNCVRTKWPSASDECAGAPAKIAKREVRSRVMKEERTVYFDFNKSTLNANEKTKLDEVSRIITESKEVDSVDIVGYADRIGNTSYNKRLSTKRAETVKSYLAARGLKTRNVRLEGLGETGSVTQCSDSEKRSSLIACLAEDRRVEIQLNVKQ